MEYLAIIVGTIALVAAALAVGAVLRGGSTAPVANTDEDRESRERLIGQIAAMEEKLNGTRSAVDTVGRSVDILSQNNGRRGAWGEVTLRRLLENLGLLEGTDFDVQMTIDGARPDAAIHLTNGTTVLMDVKMPLDDLRKAENADDAVQRKAHLKSHAATVRRHAADVAKRNYPSRIQATFAPVVMYLPVEGAWQAAVEVDPDIFTDLVKMGIHPASPATFGMVLDVLKQYALSVSQAESVKEILAEARTLVERLGTHADHLVTVGKELNSAVAAYNKAIGNLGNRVAPAARAMSKHLGERDLADVTPVEALAQPERAEGLDFKGAAA